MCVCVRGGVLGGGRGLVSVVFDCMSVAKARASEPCLSTLASSFSNVAVHPGFLWKETKQGP